MLWQVAVLHCNRRVLQALVELSKTPECEFSPRVELTNLVGFALTLLQSDVGLAFVDWIYATFPDKDAQQRMFCGISNAQFDEPAQKMENLTITEWIRDHGYTFPASMMGTAASAGNLELVRFLHDHGNEGCTAEAMDSAASNGHLEVVQFLHANRQEGCTYAAKTRALQNGHLEVLRFLHQERSNGSCSSMAVLLGAMRGRLECLEFAHEHNFPGFDRSAMSYAMLWGHVDVVRFLHEHRPTEGCTLGAVMTAERLGHHEVVDYLCRYRPTYVKVTKLTISFQQQQMIVTLQFTQMHTVTSIHIYTTSVSSSICYTSRRTPLLRRTFE